MSRRRSSSPATRQDLILSDAAATAVRASERPEPDAARPEPDAARPEPDAARPEPDAARPDPDGAPADSQDYDYDRYSQLTGPLTDPPDGVGTVRFRRTPGARPTRQLIGALVMLAIQTTFVAWLLLPGHLPRLTHSMVLSVGSIVMVGSIYLIELFRLINVGSLCIASALAQDPVPMTAEPGTRVAFLTSIVPSSEPLAVLRHTLEAARKIRHTGSLDVWVLDEGDDPAVRSMGLELGVNHFTRSGVEKFNQPAGRYKARSKHGNYNSWITAHGAQYEFFVSVDLDHVPLASLCERMLGYFRDPDVAFVVGPQVYGNFDNFVTRGAESQQFVFHGLIQRLGNRFGSPMLVGTNNAGIELAGPARPGVTGWRC